MKPSLEHPPPENDAARGRGGPSVGQQCSGERASYQKITRPHGEAANARHFVVLNRRGDGVMRPWDEFATHADAMACREYLLCIGLGPAIVRRTAGTPK